MRALGFNPDDTLPKTFDLDRVEVLRGPQGTLFGAGSEGGTVRYIMTQPSVTQDIHLRAQRGVVYAEYGQPSCEAGIAHGGPIIDGVLGFRASFWYRYDGGWIDRIDAATGHHRQERQPRQYRRGALGAAVSADRQREDHAEPHVPEQAPA